MCMMQRMHRIFTLLLCSAYLGGREKRESQGDFQLQKPEGHGLSLQRKIQGRRTWYCKKYIPLSICFRNDVWDWESLCGISTLGHVWDPGFVWQATRFVASLLNISACVTNIVIRCLLEKQWRVPQKTHMQKHIDRHNMWWLPVWVYQWWSEGL